MYCKVLKNFRGRNEGWFYFPEKRKLLSLHSERCLFFVFMEGLNLDNILQYWGVHSAGLLAFIEVAVRIGIVAVIAWATYLIARKWLARVITKLADKTSTRWDDLMFDQHFFNYFALFYYSGCHPVSL